MFIYFLFLITLFVGTNIHASDTQITLQFSDKTTKKYPLKDVRLFKFIKNMVEDIGYGPNEVVPLQVSEENFKILLDLRVYLEEQKEARHQIDESKLVSHFKTKLLDSGITRRNDWTNDITVNFYKLIPLCEAANYLTGSDLADELHAKEPHLPSLLEVLTRIFIEHLKNKRLPDKEDLDEASHDLQKIIAGMLLGDMILDTSLNPIPWPVCSLEQEDSRLKISPYASDRNIVGYGTRATNHWLVLLNKTDNMSTYKRKEIDLPSYTSEGFYYATDCFGVTSDDKYLYAISTSSKRDSLKFTFYNNETGQFKEKNIERDLLLHIYSSVSGSDDVSSNSKDEGKVEVEPCRILYDKKSGIFSIIFLIKAQTDEYGALGIASCTVDSDFDVYINGINFKRFREQLDKPAGIEAKKENAQKPMQRLLEVTEDLKGIPWQYINDYIVGITDFKKPGLLYALPRNNQSSGLYTLTYDDTTKKWSSDQKVPDFISISYPRPGNFFVGRVTSDSEGVRVISAYVNSFVPHYKQILNEAIKRLYAKMAQNEENLNDSEPKIFDVANLRYVTKNIANQVYAYDVMQPALRNVIEIMSNNEEMQTIANAWYIYHASKNTEQYQRIDEKWFTEFRIPAEIQKQYPLPGGGIRTASTLVMKPKTSKLLQGYLKPIDLQATKKASATVSAYAALSKLKKTMPEKKFSFLEPKREAQATVTTKVLPSVDVGLNLPPVKVEPIRETVTVQPAPEVNEGFIQKTVKKIKEYLSYFKFW